MMQLGNIKRIAEEVCDASFVHRRGAYQQIFQNMFMRISTYDGNNFTVVVSTLKDNILQRECNSLYQLKDCIRSAIRDARTLCKSRLLILPSLLPEQGIDRVPDLKMDDTIEVLDLFIRKLYPEASLVSTDLLGIPFHEYFLHRKAIAWKTPQFEMIFRPVCSWSAGVAKIKGKWSVKFSQGDIPGARNKWSNYASPQELGEYSSYYVHGNIPSPSNIALSIFVCESSKMIELLELLPEIENEPDL